MMDKEAPYKSRAQIKKFFAMEAEGDLPAGTARAWAHHTPSIEALPEHVKAKKKKRAKHAEAHSPPNYRPAAEPMTSCGACRFFERASSTCHKYAQQVDTNSVCDRFESVGLDLSKLAKYAAEQTLMPLKDLTAQNNPLPSVMPKPPPTPEEQLKEQQTQLKLQKQKQELQQTQPPPAPTPPQQAWQQGQQAAFIQNWHARNIKQAGLLTNIFKGGLQGAADGASMGARIGGPSGMVPGALLHGAMGAMQGATTPPAPSPSPSTPAGLPATKAGAALRDIGQLTALLRGELPAAYTKSAIEGDQLEALSDEADAAPVHLCTACGKPTTGPDHCTCPAKTAAYNPHDDVCPTCNTPATGSCRCWIGDRHCANGHNWHRCPVHKTAILGNGHGKGYDRKGQCTYSATAGDLTTPDTTAGSPRDAPAASHDKQGGAAHTGTVVKPYGSDSQAAAQLHSPATYRPVPLDGKTAAPGNLGTKTAAVAASGPATLSSQGGEATVPPCAHVKAANQPDTAFAAGFVQACRDRGLTYEQTAALIKQAAADSLFGPEFTKLALPSEGAIADLLKTVPEGLGALGKEVAPITESVLRKAPTAATAAEQAARAAEAGHVSAGVHPVVPGEAPHVRTFDTGGFHPSTVGMPPYQAPRAPGATGNPVHTVPRPLPVDVPTGAPHPGGTGSGSATAPVEPAKLPGSFTSPEAMEANRVALAEQQAQARAVAEAGVAPHQGAPVGAAVKSAPVPGAATGEAKGVTTEPAAGSPAQVPGAAHGRPTYRATEPPPLATDAVPAAPEPPPASTGPAAPEPPPASTGPAAPAAPPEPVAPAAVEPPAPQPAATPEPPPGAASAPPPGGVPEPSMLGRARAEAAQPAWWRKPFGVAQDVLPSTYNAGRAFNWAADRLGSNANSWWRQGLAHAGNLAALPLRVSTGEGVAHNLLGGLAGRQAAPSLVSRLSAAVPGVSNALGKSVQPNYWGRTGGYAMAGSGVLPLGAWAARHVMGQGQPGEAPPDVSYSAAFGLPGAGVVDYGTTLGRDANTISQMLFGGRVLPFDALTGKPGNRSVVDDYKNTVSQVGDVGKAIAGANLPKLLDTAANATVVGGMNALTEASNRRTGQNAQPLLPMSMLAQPIPGKATQMQPADGAQPAGPQPAWAADPAAALDQLNTINDHVAAAPHLQALGVASLLGTAAGPQLGSALTGLGGPVAVQQHLHTEAQQAIARTGQQLAQLGMPEALANAQAGKITPPPPIMVAKATEQLTKELADMGQKPDANTVQSLWDKLGSKDVLGGWGQWLLIGGLALGAIGILHGLTGGEGSGLTGTLLGLGGGALAAYAGASAMGGQQGPDFKGLLSPDTYTNFFSPQPVGPTHAQLTAPGSATATLFGAPDPAALPAEQQHQLAGTFLQMQPSEQSKLVQGMGPAQRQWLTQTGLMQDALQRGRGAMQQALQQRQQAVGGPENAAAIQRVVDAHKDLLQQGQGGLPTLNPAGFHADTNDAHVLQVLHELPPDVQAKVLAGVRAAVTGPVADGYSHMPAGTPVFGHPGYVAGDIVRLRQLLQQAGQQPAP